MVFDQLLTKTIFETTILINCSLKEGGMLKSVRSLKAELSACLQRVQRGEECLVTSHHQVIARIIPVQSPVDIKGLNRKNFLVELAKKLIVPKKATISLSQLIIQQRQNERY
jgi:antitoxin (DNA-binding transcriptional repressor) of toxin-antitoxin stability system